MGNKAKNIELIGWLDQKAQPVFGKTENKRKGKQHIDGHVSGQRVSDVT